MIMSRCGWSFKSCDLHLIELPGGVLSSASIEKQGIAACASHCVSVRDSRAFHHDAGACPQYASVSTMLVYTAWGHQHQSVASLGTSIKFKQTRSICQCRPVSLNGGMPMPAWFDLAQLDQLLKGEQDGPGVAASIAHIGVNLPPLSPPHPWILSLLCCLRMHAQNGVDCI